MNMCTNVFSMLTPLAYSNSSLISVLFIGISLQHLIFVGTDNLLLASNGIKQFQSIIKLIFVIPMCITCTTGTCLFAAVSRLTGQSSQSLRIYTLCYVLVTITTCINPNNQFTFCIYHMVLTYRSKSILLISKEITLLLVL